MVDRSRLANSFEFVVTAGARARQLMKGARPRVEADSQKKTTIAQREVELRVVEKIEKNDKIEKGDKSDRAIEDAPASEATGA
jgi:DNA-directed RNA polymerase subunit K/omega